MNKQAIDNLIPKSYEVLIDVKIAENGSVPKQYQGYISSFGAAIVMGSLVAAVAFFSKEDAASKKDTKLLMNAIYKLITSKDATPEDNLLTYVIANNNAKTKEDILNSAIAIKLAMNMYRIEKE